MNIRFDLRRDCNGYYIYDTERNCSLDIVDIWNILNKFVDYFYSQELTQKEFDDLLKNEL